MDGNIWTSEESQKIRLFLLVSVRAQLTVSSNLVAYTDREAASEKYQKNPLLNQKMVYGLKQHPQMIKTIASMVITAIIRMHKIILGKKQIGNESNLSTY
ncbi:hypothetical protein Ltuc_1668 [Legionella tucsonensis]|uniref:Uncharacterized protein n=1 Tax=Legionella tucsonensis TaxID=40335 RepID=A0A0W0ZXE2_9GAMM|nr:hypothetical protein Ltuc_1668 [Legionella tucsonensis]